MPVSANIQVSVMVPRRFHKDCCIQHSDFCKIQIGFPESTVGVGGTGSQLEELPGPGLNVETGFREMNSTFRLPQGSSSVVPGPVPYPARPRMLPSESLPSMALGEPLNFGFSLLQKKTNNPCIFFLTGRLRLE